ncbi:uncharacterized protein ACB058_001880 isoform 1-T1 [Synchiropus picturatus]
MSHTYRNCLMSVALRNPTKMLYFIPNYSQSCFLVVAGSIEIAPFYFRDGAAAFVVPAAMTEESLKVTLSLHPSASHVFLYECVLFKCQVHNSTAAWNFQWFRHTPHTALRMNPRYMKTWDIFTITAVSIEDAGNYWCKADRWDNKSTTVLLSQVVNLNVSDAPSSSLVLSQDTRQIFSGSQSPFLCPENNSTVWEQRSSVDDHTGVNSDLQPVLYWCESAEARSNAVLITSVSVVGVIIKTPSFAVPEGTEVVISCQNGKEGVRSMRFFKDGIEIPTNTSYIGQRTTAMTLDHVTLADQGIYQCASEDGLLESQGSWFSVKGSWEWAAGSCVIVLLLVIPLGSWLCHLYWKQVFSARSCWRASSQKTLSPGLPVTKQDTTEVQWDLEMSNLLDKQQNPGA